MLPSFRRNVSLPRSTTIPLIAMDAGAGVSIPTPPIRQPRRVHISTAEYGLSAGLDGGIRWNFGTVRWSFVTCRPRQGEEWAAITEVRHPMPSSRTLQRRPFPKLACTAAFMALSLQTNALAGDEQYRLQGI